MSSTNIEQVKVLFQDANDLCDKGNWKKAKENLQAFFKVVPKDEAFLDIKTDAHILMAKILSNLSDPKGSMENAQKAMDIAKSINDRSAEVNALRWISHDHFMTSEFDKALKGGMEGLALAKDLGKHRLEGIFNIQVAMVYSTTGNLGKAEMHYREAILSLERTGDKRQLARAYNNLGDNFMMRGKFDRAVTFFSKCMKVAENTGNDDFMAFGAFNRAESYFELGNYKAAIADLEISIPILEKMGDIYGLAGANQIYGLVHAKKGDWNKAEEYLLKARRLSQKISMPMAEAKIIRDIGRMYKWRGDQEKARLYLKEAMAIFNKHGAAGELHKMKDDMEGL